MRQRRTMRYVAMICGALVVGLAGTGCESIPQLDRRPLYQQLGGVEAIARISDRFLRELSADPQVADHFRGIDARRFRDQVAAQLCQVADGPCEYDGGSMLDVHRGMDIDQRAFNAVVEDLIRAMESLRVPIPAQNRLLARLAPMREDIVTATARDRWTDPNAAAPDGR